MYSLRSEGLYDAFAISPRLLSWSGGGSVVGFGVFYLNVELNPNFSEK